MALINCTECGKEVSDKAISCPHCGNPISKKIQEDYLCCPKCYSKELHSEQKGFSGSKALAGALLTGGVGILAGTIGSKEVTITCLKCGNKFKAGEALTISSSDEDIEELLIPIIQKGDIINAIKLYRDKKHVDLQTAKSKVEFIKAKHNIISAQKSGCAGMLVIFIAIGSILSCIIYS